MTTHSSSFIDIVFDGPPAAVSGRFIEVEDETGASITHGEWVKRPDGYWALRIVAEAVPVDRADSIRRIERGLRDRQAAPSQLGFQYLTDRAVSDALGTAYDAGRATLRDEHHTMEELYDYRMLYNALAFNAWASAGTFPVVKSWRHSDGELCFGGGWFIVVATLPTGQVSNHYSAEHWPLFQVPEAAPPEYDGHTPEVAAQRMRDLLAPVPGVIPHTRGRCDYVDPDEGRCLLLDEHTDDHWPSMADLSTAAPTNGAPS